MTDNHLLRMIPKVDEMLHMPALRDSGLSLSVLTDCVRRVLEDVRSGILQGTDTAEPNADALCRRVLDQAAEVTRFSLRRVINGTGVVLHTNLGRSPIAAAAVQAAADVAASYSTLEYDVAGGCRGSRYSHVESLLCQLTGCEAALVVNNNAAAVLLILTALGRGKEAVVSRGELVEIGGSFRVPDIMEQGGCILREVGTTNKTHLRDYENAINENTFALMKVHTSNYRIMGFTESVSLAALAELAHGSGLPLIEDLGSGALVDLARYGITDEPNVAASIAAGVDLVCFSGDKLLGGPQAGIILGKKEYVDLLKQHQLLRAFRIDKMTLAALEATLRLYAAGEEKEIPIYFMLSRSEESLKGQAERLCAAMCAKGIKASCIPVGGQVGGGSVPTRLLPGWAVAVEAEISANALEERLRMRDIPIVGRIMDDRWLLDVRTLLEADEAEILSALEEVLV